MPPKSIPPRCGNLGKSLSGRGFSPGIDHDGQVTTYIAAELNFAATPAPVWQMLISPEYVAFKRAQMGAVECTVTYELGRTILTYTRPVAGELPAGAAALIGPSAHIVETQSWSEAGPAGERIAELNITIGQAPATVSGTAHMRATYDTTTISIQLSISVSIPLFGGTAEKFIQDQLEKFIAAEQQLGNEWLARQ